MAQKPLAIFLSPHFDDIPLSCGGVAARLSRLGARCIGITIFTAPAPQGLPLSPFARKMHDDWERSSGDTATVVNEVRRAEERAAMRLLNLEPVWLDLPDAPYRQGADGHYLYTSNPELLGPVAREERHKLVPWIAGQISRVVSETGARGRVRVFAPLGVGCHVDHQLAFWAARGLGPRYGVLFYEDFPYAARQGALQARITELAALGMPLQPRITPITDLISIKIAAIARYKSQLDVLFGSSEDMQAAVRAYSQSVAGDAPNVQYAERTWFIPPSYRLR
jgi:LmbE family N-acetylglucosaminyl deacetylase